MDLKVSENAITRGPSSVDEPLYKRVPKRDETGRPLSDFMMLIPGLKQCSASDFKKNLNLLHRILDEFDEVVFADLNIPLNLLWVSVRSRNGVTRDLSAAIRRQIPQAMIVGHTTIHDEEESRHPENGIESDRRPQIESSR